MRIGICDDDISCLKQTKHAIERWALKKAVPVALSCFDSGDLLIQAHEKCPFDVLFLDIYMPSFTGMDVAREIRTADMSTEIVFLTSSPDFAIESYSVQARNYLLKPIQTDQLEKTLDALYTSALLHRRSTIVKVGNTFQRIYLDEIEYIESLNRGTTVSMINKEKLHSNQPFHEIEETLVSEAGFFKCHRSYIVNLSRIDAYTKGEIKTATGMKIPISRSCTASFEEAYFAQIFGKVGDP